MGHVEYDVLQVCINGHKITDRYNSRPEERKKRCAHCGAETIYKCPECKTPLKGYLHEDEWTFGRTFHPTIPDHCEDCGKPFPWTLNKEEDQGGETMGPEPVTSNKVFIVHGHDEGMKQHLARVLSSIGLMPVILHEQPSRGKTIIEKLEHYISEVGYAVVLLSPDDIGYSKRDGETEAKPRARQNVVLELGYLAGRLERDRVCVLQKGNLESPGDIDGVVYVSYDEGGEGWKKPFGRELKAAGYDIDTDKLLTEH